VGLPERVELVEVSPRDGLQNEPELVPLEIKLGLIDRLGAAGVRVIESTSFVSPRWVPQMADHAELMKTLARRPGVRYPVLVPNMRGLETALESGVQEIAVFTAASETFNRKNINCGVDESFERLEPVVELALQRGLRVRGYVSCVLGCPYEGAVPPAAVARVAERLIALGCQGISLGDTIGVGTALAAARMVETVAERVPIAQLAVHFHDTYGQALANLLAVLQLGISVIDASVAGLGGCPYAKGASGNVASENVVYMLDGLGIETGIDLETLIAAGWYICDALGRPPQGKVARAMRPDRS